MRGRVTSLASLVPVIYPLRTDVFWSLKLTTDFVYTTEVMDFLKLPEEVQGHILLQLPLLSILSCSHAVPQARRITTSDRFLNRYVQQYLKAPWVKFDMVRKFESLCFPLYRLWYLETLTCCHKDLAHLCKMSHPLQSFGLFMYVLTSWVVLNKDDDFPPRSELCPECSSYPFLQSVISDANARDLLVQFCLGCPEIFTLTVLDTEDTDIGDSQPDYFEYLVEEIAEKKDVDTDDFEFKYHMQLAYRATKENSPNDEVRWWSVVVGHCNWIVVSGFEKEGENYEHLWRGSYMELGSSFSDTIDAFRSVSQPVVDWMTSEIDFTEEDFCFRKLEHKFETNFSTIRATLNKVSTALKKEGEKIAEYMQSLNVKAKKMQKLKNLINTNLKKDEKVNAKSEVSEAVIVLSLLRLLQKVFSVESQKYLDDKSCQSFLQRRVDDEDDTEESENSEGSEESGDESEQLPITSSLLGLWPIFLVQHSLIAIPVLGRLLLKDLQLVEEGCEGKPLSESIIDLLTAETHRCGLTWFKSRKPRPPLCELIRCG